MTDRATRTRRAAADPVPVAAALAAAVAGIYSARVSAVQCHMGTEDGQCPNPAAAASPMGICMHHLRAAAIMARRRGFGA